MRRHPARRQPNPAYPASLLMKLSRGHRTLLRGLGRMADKQGVALYLVGGVVRDLLLNRNNLDLDLAVEGDGIAFARRMCRRYRTAATVFDKFATARLRMPSGLKLDVASTRRESYVHAAALPAVEPASLQEDLYRRDFTINAMAIKLNALTFGRLEDPFEGVRDLSAKRIRILHEGSFQDDPTRIFRAIRFAERFGFTIESKTGRLLAEAASTDFVARLSGPRLRNEIFLLLGEHRPSRSMEQLDRLKLLRFLHPTLRYGKAVRRVMDSLSAALAWWEGQTGKRPADIPMLRLMALLSQSGPSVIRAVAQRLQLSSAQAVALSYAEDRTARLLVELSRERILPSEVYRSLAPVPDEAFVLVAAKARVLRRSKAADRVKRRLNRYLRRDRHLRITVDGHDLATLGLKPGPQFKIILDRLLEARIDGKVRSAAEERKLASRMVLEAGKRRQSPL
ncbi:conserved protein of unknown function [Nitrospira japonica]|uniref:CCA tRNA nucleotidyltransferase n=2 Tax=Nitrospira japonica TaxID=1325564 RepID=A0A1W1I660_9BACT|nr:conserved protein of unknown function [Nitrospira japonica]